MEDALELVGRDAEAGISDAEGGPGVAGDGEGTADVDGVGGVLDGVVEEIEDGRAEIFRDAEGVEVDRAGDRLEGDGVGGEVVALDGDGDTVGDERLEV